MEFTEKRFAPGEWVEVIDGRLKGFSGYILKYDIVDDEYKVKFTRNNLGEKVSGILRIDSDCLVECQSFKDEDDLLAMVDLALDTQDKEWFAVLTAQLPKELPF